MLLKNTTRGRKKRSREKYESKDLLMQKNELLACEIDAYPPKSLLEGNSIATSTLLVYQAIGLQILSYSSSKRNSERRRVILPSKSHIQDTYFMFIPKFYVLRLRTVNTKAYATC